MIALQNLKVAGTGLLTSATNATATTKAFDMFGADYASVLVIGVPASAATASSHWTSIVLQEGDAATGAWSDVPGFVSGTDFTVAGNASTSEPYIAKLDVDLRGRKRYLNVEVQAANSTLDDFRVVVLKGRNEEAPNSASEAGVTNWVKG